MKTRPPGDPRPLWANLRGIIVLCAVALIGCAELRAQPAASQPAADAGYLRIMSFNLRLGGPLFDQMFYRLYAKHQAPGRTTGDDSRKYWTNRRQLAFDVIRRYRPDLIGLQEAFRTQLDDLLKQFSQYSFVGTGRFGGEQGEYCPILYLTDRFKLLEQGTFWFSETPQTSGSIGWGSKLPRTCTWARLIDKNTSRAFYLYNVHLDSGSQYARQRSIALLASRIHQRRHSDPPVLTGDFNAGENNPVILYVKGLRTDPGLEPQAVPPPPRLIDTFRLLHPHATNVGTYHAFKGTTTGPKIDYIFAPPRTDVPEAAIIHASHNGVHPSDHFPVFARLRLPAKAPSR